MTLALPTAALWLLAAPAPSEALLRQVVAEVALAQVQRMDARWTPQQRDCAGLVRFAYRSAYRRLGHAGGGALWSDGRGKRLDFADAQTLLTHSFAPLGRGPTGRSAVQSGDLLAFRQEGAHGPTFHLMLVVAPADRAHAAPRVVYHPGEGASGVRLGALDELFTQAPHEWRPAPENPAFLGFYRFKEWMHD